MALEDYKNKDSVVIVYTGEGKGKTSAAMGLLVRALGADMRVAFVQFIKTWQVSEHKFIKSIGRQFKDKLVFYKGGKGFHNLGELSARGVTAAQHKKAALDTYKFALGAAKSGALDLIICDEINVAYQKRFVTKKQLEELIFKRNPKTSLCLTGRGFPSSVLEKADIATEMKKLKHHFDDKYLANRGIDY